MTEGGDTIGAVVTSRPTRGVRMAGRLGVRDAGRALRDFATYLPTQAIPAIAGFLVLPLLARRLAPTELGVLAIAQTLVTLGWTLAGSWLSAAIIRELPAHRTRGELGAFVAILRRALAITFGGLAAFTILLLIAAVASKAIASNLWLIVAGSVGLTLQNIAVTMFAAELRPRLYALVEVLARTSGIAIGMTLVFEGHKVHGYLVGLASASLVVGSVGLLLAWPRGARPAAKPAPDLGVWVRYGFPASLSAITLWGLFFVDRYLLAGLRNEGAVGIYSVGAVVGDKSVSIPMLAFFTGAAPLLIRAFEQKGRYEVERLMRSYTRILILLGLPVIAFLVVNAGVLVPLLAGSQYYTHSARGVAPLVAAGSFFYGLALIGNTGLVIAKKTLPLAAGALVGLVVNVVANVALIPPFGIKGAAVATPIAMLAYLLVIQVEAHRHVRWMFPYRTLARATASSIFGLLVAHELELLTAVRAADLAIGVVAGGLAYVGGLWLLREHRSIYLAVHRS